MSQKVEFRLFPAWNFAPMQVEPSEASMAPVKGVGPLNPGCAGGSLL